jgi:hypothetical protein
MGDWDRLHSACKDATGKEIEDLFDASQIIEELDSKCKNLEEKNKEHLKSLMRLYEQFKIWYSRSRNDAVDQCLDYVLKEVEDEIEKVDKNFERHFK